MLCRNRITNQHCWRLASGLVKVTPELRTASPAEADRSPFHEGDLSPRWSTTAAVHACFGRGNIGKITWT